MAARLVSEALRSRLASLMIGAKGASLDTRRSTSLEDLFDRPVVLELQHLRDDEEKSFVMALVFAMLYQYCEVRQLHLRPQRRQQLQHLTLIEEAHRLLAAPAGGSGEAVAAQAQGRGTHSTPQSDHQSDEFAGKKRAIQRAFRWKRMRAPLALTVIALGLASGPAFAGGDPTAAGFWQQVDNDGHVGGWFYFAKVNGLYEGRLVKMFNKPGYPVFDVCAKCTGKQRNAPMLGLVIIKDMKRDRLKYEDGSILDPRGGTVYHAQMELSPDSQKLSVRGYLGIPLLGQTQIWTRLPDNAMAPADIPKESVSATNN